MTSSIRNESKSAGFTLVELLIVVGILASLVGILLPTIITAMKQGERLRNSADLHTIGVALEAYKRDFGEFPRVAFAEEYTPGDWSANGMKNANPPMGAQILCQALIGPLPDVDPTNKSSASGGKRPIQDGASGPGFRTRSGGKIWPAYLPPDRFQYGDPDQPANVSASVSPETNGLRFCILDANRKPILYFPRSNSKVDIHAKLPDSGGDAVGSYMGSDWGASSSKTLSERAMFDADDNLIWFGRDPTNNSSAPLSQRMGDQTNARKRIRLMMGDNDANGIIDPGETAAFTGEYILWAAGPDQQFGPTMEMAAPKNVLDAADAAKCDDVTNFKQ